MARPLKTYPRRHVVSFRMDDREFAAFQYLVNQYKRANETFSEAVGRIIQQAVLNGAQKRYADFAEHHNRTMEALKTGKPYAVSHTQEDPEKRRKHYYETCAKAARAHYEQGAEKAPKRADLGELVSISSSVVARPEADTQAQAEAGDSPTEKIEKNQPDRAESCNDSVLQGNSQNFPQN